MQGIGVVFEYGERLGGQEGVASGDGARTLTFNNHFSCQPAASRVPSKAAHIPIRDSVALGAQEGQESLWAAVLPVTARTSPGQWRSQRDG